MLADVPPNGSGSSPPPVRHPSLSLAFCSVPHPTGGPPGRSRVSRSGSHLAPEALGQQAPQLLFQFDRAAACRGTRLHSPVLSPNQARQAGSQAWNGLPRPSPFPALTGAVDLAKADGSPAKVPAGTLSDSHAAPLGLPSFAGVAASGVNPDPALQSIAVVWFLVSKIQAGHPFQTPSWIPKTVDTGGSSLKTGVLLQQGKKRFA